MKAQQKQMAELRQLQQELDETRKKAMAKPALVEKRDALQKEIEAAMVEEDPESKKQLERFEELRGEFESARKEGNQERAQKLAGELQPLGQSLQQTQKKVMQQAEIKSAAESFQEHVISTMKDLNPKTEKLLARAQTLSKKLRGGAPMMRPPGQ